MASNLYSWISKRFLSFKNWISQLYRSVLSTFSDRFKVQDDQSETSTLVYTQEPFDTFKDRVSLLFQEVFATSNDNLTIDRMEGGSSHRVVGVSVAGDGSKPVLEHFIIRVPRFPGLARGPGFPYDFVDGVAPLQLLRQKSTIPVPEVVKFDTTETNVLGRAYVIMKRIPGESLCPSWWYMSDEARGNIAQSLGKAVAEMHSVTSTAVGKIALPASHEDSSKESYMIQPFVNLETNTDVPHEIGPARMNTFDTICEIIKQQKELLINTDNDPDYELEFYDQWQGIASEMNDLGIFDQDGYCICHLDFEPRNIMSDQEALTGILDWDTALFAPLFMSCRPPIWVWDDDLDKYFDDYEQPSGKTPPTPETRRFKKLFEDAAGPTYLRYAYLPQYRLARMLFRFIVDGVFEHDTDQVRLLQSEWDEVRGALELARSAKTPMARAINNPSTPHVSESPRASV